MNPIEQHMQSIAGQSSQSGETYLTAQQSLFSAMKLSPKLE